MITLDAGVLREIFPGLFVADFWARALNEACSRYEINANRARMASFLGQIGHESQHMKRLTENLNYRSAERIQAVFGRRRFPTPEQAEPYVENPEALANRVYAKRLGNGTVKSGDGWKYRGRGLIMVTGRENYRATSAALGLGTDLLEDPDKLAEMPLAAMSAAWFWHAHGLNALAEDANAFEEITRRISGGRLGLYERGQLRTRAALVLSPV